MYAAVATAPTRKASRSAHSPARWPTRSGIVTWAATSSWPSAPKPTASCCATSPCGARGATTRSTTRARCRRSSSRRPSRARGRRSARSRSRRRSGTRRCSTASICAARPSSRVIPARSWKRRRRSCCQPTRGSRCWRRGRTASVAPRCLHPTRRTAGRPAGSRGGATGRSGRASSAPSADSPRRRCRWRSTPSAGRTGWRRRSCGWTRERM